VILEMVLLRINASLVFRIQPGWQQATENAFRHGQEKAVTAMLESETPDEKFVIHQDHACLVYSMEI